MDQVSRAVVAIWALVTDDVVGDGFDTGRASLWVRHHQAFKADITILTVEVQDSGHLSVGAVTTLVTLETGSGVETRLEGSNGARVSNTTSLGNETRNSGTIVSAESGRLRLDEFNSIN